MLDSEGLTIDASALYLIAVPSTPAKARKAVLEKASSTDGIT